MTLLDSASFMLQPLMGVNRKHQWDFFFFLNCGEHFQTAFGAEVSPPAPANPILDSSGQQTNSPCSSKAFYWPWNRHHFKDIHWKALFFHVTQLTRLLYTHFCLCRGHIKNGCRTNWWGSCGWISISGESCILCRFCEFDGEMVFALLGTSQGCVFIQNISRINIHVHTPLS